MFNKGILLARAHRSPWSRALFAWQQESGPQTCLLLAQSRCPGGGLKGAVIDASGGQKMWQQPWAHQAGNQRDEEGEM